ncbi:ABC1 kinase family protein [Limosilactobacillus difficilis]|uniref:ABC1 kinase family protein n=1 Tax=Limosilactobacillus difficilis TaxID=2991838 RepID=UPI0024B8E1A1|nr:AarF/UbiB family protein [Limosilactobacillus difficilis]
MKQASIDRSKRLKEIIRIVRRYQLVSNFYHQTNPQAVRQALEELGPTFIKAGQMLSTRPDLVSPAYIKELQNLQDHVQIDDFQTVQQSVQDALHKPLKDVFQSFASQPFASASIGQTHHAILYDGTEVVVKVQHPHVQELVKTDLALFDQALKILKIVPTGKMAINPERVYHQLKTSLLNEIDTEKEIRNGIEFYRLNNGDDIIQAPKVYAKESAQGLLVNQAMPGKSIKHLIHTPLSQTPEQREQQINERRYLAQVLIRNFIKQVFVDHYFHADPHPGNIMFYRLQNPESAGPNSSTNKSWSAQWGKTDLTVEQTQPLPPFRLVYLDFGMMGRLTANLADGIADVVIALNSKDSHFIGQAILAICNQTGTVDQVQFENSLAAFLRPYFSAGLGDIDFTKLTFEIINLCEQNHLQMKPEVTLLIKAFALLESTVAALDPNISMMDVARPFARRLMIKRFNWREMMDEQLTTLSRGIKAGSQLPLKVNELLDNISKGQARINLHYQNENRVLQALDRIINRLLIAIILAATILGSSILVEGSVNHPAINQLGVAGYCIAIAVIIVLVLTDLFNHWRHRQR